MALTIEQIREFVIQASAINRLNVDGEVKIQIGKLLDQIDVNLQRYLMEVRGEKNKADSRKLAMVRQVEQHFSDMTDSIKKMLEIKHLT